jgi:hypothetical protein
MAAGPSPEEFVRALGKEDRVLVNVRDQLYGGDWKELERDLAARLSGKPYIFKLASKIEEDLGRIDRLRGYEAAHGVDLGELLGKSESAGEVSEAS